MDLAKMKNDRKLYLCKFYFWAGFLFLPFLWAINSIWFYKEAFIRQEYEEQKFIKKYVIRSMLGAIFWIIALISWITVFQINRADWGKIGDDLSFVIPTGRA